MRRTFTLEYWLDEGWYVGRLKEVPGVFSQGETLKDLEDNIQDAYELMQSGQDGPTPLDVYRNSAKRKTGSRTEASRDSRQPSATSFGASSA
jgi:predicted RNase H-like HicB family nuclease